MNNTHWAATTLAAFVVAFGVIAIAIEIAKVVF